MPLYHATALIMGFSHVLSVGATLALGRKFSTSNFWNEVRSHDATIMQYVGETCRYLLAAPPSVDPRTGESLDKKHKVRIAFGNGLRPDIWNRFKDRFGIKTVAEFYGLTEGSFGTWNLSRNDFTVGAVGRHGALYKIFLGRDAAIVELDFDREEPRRDPRTGFCKRVRTGEPGELMWRLPPKNIESRFQGYYGDEQSTSKKVMRSVFAKDDAWLRTGDVMRADRENRLYFTDRIGDTFRWKCQNVSTAEVAANLGQHPAVLELNVYGVQVPHHDGRAGCAAIKFHLSAEQDGSPKADVLQSLAGHAQAGLPKYAVPQFLRVVRGSGLEATGTNKYPKNMLRDQGIVPDKAHPDEIFWLRENTYVKFDGEAWKKLSAESVRL